MNRARLDRSPQKLLEDALAIWTAGVRAVNGFRLVTEQLKIDDHWLGLPDADLWMDLKSARRVFVAGAGKAAAAMAQGAAQVLSEFPSDRLEGHVQIPEEANFDREVDTFRAPFDCRPAFAALDPLEIPPPWLQLHRVRPAGANLVTATTVERTHQLIRKVRELGPDDICVFLLSGGASALLSAPIPGLTYEDKNQITRFLSSVGAPIEDINAVRSALSQVKAGGFARGCRAGHLLTLVISDVLGDPLSSIGSGPTFADGLQPLERANRALDVLHVYDPQRQFIRKRVYESLEHYRRINPPSEFVPPGVQSDLVVLGNTATAVDAAGIEAERRGYSHAMHVQPPGKPELGGHAPTAEAEGRQWAELLSQMNRQPGPDCLITGGESLVDLSGSTPESRGGRNQHLALAALSCWTNSANADWARDEICFISGGTDGEDGSTSVAGACLTGEVPGQRSQRQLAPQHFLETKNSYEFFRQAGGLLITGNTRTNVCDLRVGVVKQAPT
ncbi:MAG: DUF4147 domain-containing protein [Planctomycetaceae bacterium]|nr:DUF4147 domain-containing protein [Planctomycetaceae bacterium]